MRTSSTKSAVPPAAPTPPTCSFHVVTSGTGGIAAMIFTTNESLKAWGVLHDDDLAQAIDRVLEHGRLLRLDAPRMDMLVV